MDTTIALRKNIKLYYFVEAFTGMLFTIPIWVAFEQRFLTLSQMALLEAIGFSLNVLFQIPSGALADILGRKKTMIIGWLISGFSYFITAFSKDVLSMSVGIICINIGSAFVSGADVALLYDSLKHMGEEAKYPKINIRGNLLYRMSMVFAIFLGAPLSRIFFGLPYFLRGVFNLLSIVFIVQMYEKVDRTHKNSMSSYILKLKLGMKELVKNEYTKSLTLYYVLIGGITWSCVFYFNNIFATDVGYSSQGQSYLFSFLYILTMIATMAILEYKKALHKKFVYLAFPILLAISFLPSVFANKTMAVFILIGVIISSGARFSILDSFVNEEFETAHRATALSALNMLVNIAYIIIVFFSGPIQERYSTKLVYSLLGLIVLFLVIPSGLFLIKALNKRTSSAT